MGVSEDSGELYMCKGPHAGMGQGGLISANIRLMWTEAYSKIFPRVNAVASPTLPFRS